jgi:hypothetical protein
MEGRRDECWAAGKGRQMPDRTADFGLEIADSFQSAFRHAPRWVHGSPESYVVLGAIRNPQFRRSALFAGASGFAGGVFLQVEGLGKRLI